MTSSANPAEEPEPAAANAPNGALTGKSAAAKKKKKKALAKKKKAASATTTTAGETSECSALIADALLLHMKVLTAEEIEVNRQAIATKLAAAANKKNEQRKKVAIARKEQERKRKANPRKAK